VQIPQADTLQHHNLLGVSILPPNRRQHKAQHDAIDHATTLNVNPTTSCSRRKSAAGHRRRTISKPKAAGPTANATTASRTSL